MYIFQRLLLLGIIFVCSKAASASHDIPDIKKRGELRVAVLASNLEPFFIITKDRRLGGIDYELIESIANALGVKIKLDRTSKTFDDVVECVARGKADIGVSKLSITLDRAQRVVFTEPYARFDKTLVINKFFHQRHFPEGKPRASLKMVMNRPNVRIGVVQGASYTAFAREIFPEAIVIEYGTWKKLRDDLMTGKVDALMRDDFEIKRWFMKTPTLNSYAIAVRLRDQPDHAHVIVHPSGLMLTRWLDKFITNLHPLEQGNTERILTLITAPSQN
ncbi:MAG: amino acid ABC transporter substrate-binding protein [Alphaproteobacteria bacterium]|nr:MAG: amino acid ABC transporter substrate-binding protein [Alphaproteobacteria bacterium]